MEREPSGNKYNFAPAERLELSPESGARGEELPEAEEKLRRALQEAEITSEEQMLAEQIAQEREKAREILAKYGRVPDTLRRGVLAGIAATTLFLAAGPRGAEGAESYPRSGIVLIKSEEAVGESGRVIEQSGRAVESVGRASSSEKGRDAGRVIRRGGRVVREGGKIIKSVGKIGRRAGKGDVMGVVKEVERIQRRIEYLEKIKGIFGK